MHKAGKMAVDLSMEWWQSVTALSSGEKKKGIKWHERHLDNLKL